MSVFFAVNVITPVFVFVRIGRVVIFILNSHYFRSSRCCPAQATSVCAIGLTELGMREEKVSMLSFCIRVLLWDSVGRHWMLVSVGCDVSEENWKSGVRSLFCIFSFGL